MSIFFFSIFKSISKSIVIIDKTKKPIVIVFLEKNCVDENNSISTVFFWSMVFSIYVKKILMESNTDNSKISGKSFFFSLALSNCESEICGQTDD